MKRTKAEEALSRIISYSKLNWNPRREDPFKTLIRTILSQNTSWQNEAIAYRRIDEMIGVTPIAISRAKISEIADAIKPAGMYNLRSKTIKLVSAEVIERFNGDLTSIVAKPYAEARETLMTLPGVGEKTADVVLLFNAGKYVIPIDRHIERISKRLELVSKNASYDVIRNKLEEATTQEHFLEAHIKLIQFGRDTCRSLNPKCPQCILNDLCPYQQQMTSEQAPNHKKLQTKA
jgi:endonuclease III